MAKKMTTLETLATLMERGFAASDTKFAAIAKDIADIREKMATKDDVRQIVRHEIGELVPGIMPMPLAQAAAM